MKKISFIFVVMCTLSIAAVLAFIPLKSVSQKQINQSAISIPDDVAKILQKSCTSCHDAGGNGIAMSMWNFSAWDTYSATKQSKKANAICNAVTNGSMPPSGIKQSNPERIPTEVQIGIVCKWASSLIVK